MTVEHEAALLAAPLIEKWEGFRGKAYQDSVGVWTVGYGWTHNVHPHDTISQDAAEGLLQHELERLAQSITRHLTNTPTAHELAALISFAYNLGEGALYHSTLLRKLNEGDINGAAQEFGRWTHAGGRVLQGLVNRREDEKGVFLADIHPDLAHDVEHSGRLRPQPGTFISRARHAWRDRFVKKG